MLLLRGLRSCFFQRAAEFGVLREVTMNGIHCASAIPLYLRVVLLNLGPNMTPMCQRVEWARADSSGCTLTSAYGTVCLEQERNSAESEPHLRRAWDRRWKQNRLFNSRSNAKLTAEEPGLSAAQL